MSRPSILPLLSVLLASGSHAAELTVEPKPFVVHHSFSATALPADPVLIRLDAETWTDFEITAITAHGSRVKTGDTLISFVTETIDRRLHDARQALESRKHAIAQLELDLKHLQESTPDRLDALRRAARDAKEELSYFTETRRKSTEESAAQSLKRAEQYLENQREELRQLTKMYEADDLTEETEEIIVHRQRNSVEAAEFALRMEKQEHDRTLTVSLPREAEKLEAQARNSARELAKAEAEAPRLIEQKRIELAAAKTASERETQTLAELEADRKLFEIKAASDGWFYHGTMEDGRWTTGDLVKSLVPSGKPPVKRTIASFIPADKGLKLIAALPAHVARSLSDDMKATATLSGLEHIAIPVTLDSLAQAPGTDGNHRADLSADWPEKTIVAPGTTVTVNVAAYENPAALAVPVKALAYSGKGWTIEVKLADGDTERRPVKRGRISGETAEILDGIEAGQVVVVP